MPRERPRGTDYTLFLRHLIFFGVWINFSSLCSRLSAAPWSHWSTVQRTVISIWQQLTGYTQLLGLRLFWYDGADSYLDCVLCRISWVCALDFFWMLGKSARAHTAPGSFSFETISKLFLTLCCQHQIQLHLTANNASSGYLTKQTKKTI